MSIKQEIDITLTPQQVAQAIWNLDSDKQAEMFGHLLKEAGNTHILMMQFLYCRDACEELKQAGDDSALEAFTYMFASAYKYYWERA